MSFLSVNQGVTSLGTGARHFRLPRMSPFPKLDGRVVREFSVRQALRGLNTFTWDGKNQSGAQVPRGVYLVEIVATDEEGRAGRVVGQVTVK